MFSTIRGAVVPNRNTLSHANRERNPAMAEALYWAVMDVLLGQSPAFARSRTRGRFVRRFKLMAFMTNNLDWSPRSVAELYRCRWDIEVFFKEIKQTVQLTDFLGHNASAVKWQVWMGLLVHLLLRYQAFLSRWSHSFSRLAAIVRAALWKRWHLGELLAGYGTAGGRFRCLGPPEQGLLPGFGEHTHVPMGQPNFGFGN